MSKRNVRRSAARMIRAAARMGTIRTDAESIEWIAAADAGDKPEAPKRFSMTAYTGGPMQVDRYGPPVVIDLGGLTAKAPLPILANHDLTAIVGHADEIDIGATTLKLAGIISGASPSADQVQASAAKGFPWRASVGTRPDKLEFVGEGVKTKVNGKTFTGPLYVARKATLGEVSFVAIGADRNAVAKVAAAAAHKEFADMNFDEWIEALGLDAAELRDDVLAKLRAKYDAEVKAAAKADDIHAGGSGSHTNDPPPVTPPVFDLQSVVLAHETHVTQLQATAADWQPKVDAAKLHEIQAAGMKQAIDLKAKALREQWPAPRLEAEQIKAHALFERDLIRAERPQGTFIHGSTRDGDDQVIQAAFCLSCGLREPEKHYQPEILEAAVSHRGLGIQEVLLHYARQAGYGGRQRITNANIREVIQAAFSVHTITTLLTQAGNKILLDGFMGMPQSWREVAQIRSVSDFKQVTAFRMTAALEYEEVGPGGEIQHGTLSQESYTMQAKTYARMLQLTRQDIINDDLRAFDDLRNRLGLGAAIKMNKVFWTAWLAAYNGAAFWTATRGNLVTSSALGAAGLNTAVAAFRDMEGPDGNLLSLEPDRMLVPSALEATASQLYVSMEERDTTASTRRPVANIYFKRFRPIVVPELGNSSYTGHSATTWYLLANPAQLASAIMCFLDGQQSPTIESADSDFNTLGIQFRGYHDFGVSMSEYRASVACEA